MRLAAEAGDDDRRRALGHEALDALQLLVGILLGVEDLGVEAELLGAGLDRLVERLVVVGGHRGGDDADQLCRVASDSSAASSSSVSSISSAVASGSIVPRAAGGAGAAGASVAAGARSPLVPRWRRCVRGGRRWLGALAARSPPRSASCRRRRRRRRRRRWPGRLNRRDAGRRVRRRSEHGPPLPGCRANGSGSAAISFSCYRSCFRSCVKSFRLLCLPAVEQRTDDRVGPPGLVRRSTVRTRPNLPLTAARSAPAGWRRPSRTTCAGSPTGGRRCPTSRCEVLLFCPEHDGSLGGLGRRRASARWSICGPSAPRPRGPRRRRLRAVFENRGPEVGRDDRPPPRPAVRPRRRPAGGARPSSSGATCAICAELARGHVVTAGRRLAAVVPHAATWPYELLIAPDDPRARPPVARRRRARRPGRRCWSTRLGRLDRALRRADAVHARGSTSDRPTAASGRNAHVHIEVAPLWRRRRRAALRRRRRARQRRLLQPVDVRGGGRPAAGGRSVLTGDATDAPAAGETG